jgi:ribosomal protein S27AE
MNGKIFLRFALRRGWKISLLAMAVSAVFFFLGTKWRLESVLTILPFLGILIGFLDALILWRRDEIPRDEIVNARGEYKPCPRCGGVLYGPSPTMTKKSALENADDDNVVCGGCGVNYRTSADAHLTHADYGVILQN